jgi:hypothetical protein
LRLLIDQDCPNPGVGQTQMIRGLEVEDLDQGFWWVRMGSQALFKGLCTVIHRTTRVDRGTRQDSLSSAIGGNKEEPAFGPSS